jgi:hypothetical protein
MDIIVSALVFHNFGKIRFKAYPRLSSWTHTLIVMGDLFPSKTNIVELAKAFKILRRIEPKNGLGQYALLVMSKEFWAEPQGPS